MSDPLANHKIAFGVVHFALCPFPRSCAQRWGRYSPRLHEALSAFSSCAARGTLRSLRFARALGFACAATLRFASAHLHSRRLFVVRCAILSRMHAVWLRAEYRPSPSGTPSRSLPHPAESTPLGLLSRFASLRHAIGRVSRFPLAAHPRLTAAQSAAWSNICLSGSRCAQKRLCHMLIVFECFPILPVQSKALKTSIAHL